MWGARGQFKVRRVRGGARHALRTLAQTVDDHSSHSDFSLMCDLSPVQHSQTPQVVGAGLELMVAFSQLHVFWTLIEERKVMVSLFMAAHHIKNDHRNDPFYARSEPSLPELRSS